MGIGLVSLSRNSLRRKDLRQCAEDVTQAVKVAGEITSSRVRNELKSLRRELDPLVASVAIRRAVEQIDAI
ncbi:hypothetical protein O7627_36905 [Solwaraspora sp. WMMD1047]|uniref:hypothetical protein n=1 Tax=Solwaraspora sp. WMMD1047 TaxID=3016102 RepID=UPI002415985C|nr:hypothetical protein [Solwaraspora sp. WMMD1047]MDG4834851.1 hypothetical protein [Solwaraspora sp. WMMD1047]